MRGLAIPVLLLALPALADAAKVVPVTTSSPQAAAQYRTALEYLDNVHLAETTAALQKAIALDPKFASARALLATVVPAPENEKEMQRALSDSASLPEVERVQIESFAATLRGEDAKARELRQRVADLAPDDARAFQALGAEALGDRTWDRAVAMLTRSTELDPKGAGSWNLLGYAYMMQQKYTDAVRILRKYAELAPREPNAHDSLGEALLNAGQLAEAEAEFGKAIEMDPHFAFAWMAIAETRYLRGDLSGAKEALKNEKEADVRPVDKATTDVAMATALLIEGKPAEASRAFTAAAKSAARKRLPQEYGADFTHAAFLELDGKPAEALKISSAAWKRVAASPLPAATKEGFRRAHLSIALRAQSQLKQADEANRTFGQLEESLQPVLRQAFPASQLAEARGLRKLAAGDAKGAAGEMQACLTVDVFCRMHLIRALRESGDVEAANATRDRLLGTPLRGLNFVFAWSRLRGGNGQTVAGDR